MRKAGGITQPAFLLQKSLLFFVFGRNEGFWNLYPLLFPILYVSGVKRHTRYAESLEIGGEIKATRLPDHRRIYLDFEGAISDDRGTVSRVGEGVWKPTEAAPIDEGGVFQALWHGFEPQFWRFDPGGEALIRVHPPQSPT